MLKAATVGEIWSGVAGTDFAAAGSDGVTWLCPPQL